VTRAIPYCSMDPMNRAPRYSEAQCKVCGSFNDLIRIGIEFHCRVEHHWKNWDEILEQIVQIAEPVRAA
jgi:hypothetical protein